MHSQLLSQFDQVYLDFTLSYCYHVLFKYFWLVTLIRSHRSPSFLVINLAACTVFHQLGHIISIQYQSILILHQIIQHSFVCFSHRMWIVGLTIWMYNSIINILLAELDDISWLAMFRRLFKMMLILSIHFITLGHYLVSA